MVCNLQICGPYTCSVLCYSADEGKKWKVNQVKSKLRTWVGGKKALVSTVKSVLSNRHNMKTPNTLYSYMTVCAHPYIPASLAQGHADTHTHTAILPMKARAHVQHVIITRGLVFCFFLYLFFIFWYRIKKCSYVTVSVVHTWGPNSYNIYKEKPWQNKPPHLRSFLSFKQRQHGHHTNLYDSYDVIFCLLCCRARAPAKSKRSVRVSPDGVQRRVREATNWYQFWWTHMYACSRWCGNPQGWQPSPVSFRLNTLIPPALLATIVLSNRKEKWFAL